MTSRKALSQLDERQLKAYRLTKKGVSQAEIGKRLGGLTRQRVSQILDQVRAKGIDLPRRHFPKGYKRPWSADEIALLVTMYEDEDGFSLEEMAKEIGRSYNAVDQKLDQLRKEGRIAHRWWTPWTPEEDLCVIRMSAEGCWCDEISQVIGRTVAAIHKRRLHLIAEGLIPDGGQRKPRGWRQILKLHSDGWSYQKIADEVGCPRSQVANVLHRLRVMGVDVPRSKWYKRYERQREEPSC